MKRRMRMLVAGLSLVLSAASGAAQMPAAPPASDPGEIVVHGYPPHCHPRSGDPQDAIDLTPAAAHKQQVVRIDPATGRYSLFPDDYPTTGPDAWQRDGTDIDQFVFRVPENDDPVCIGARTSRPTGFAQLRRAFPARPYWGKFVRFTAFVATRKAREVHFWLAAGAGDYVEGRQVKLGSNIVAGGAKPQGLYGNNEWKPLSMVVGPLPCMATQISYGVTLSGGGDVWLYQPKFEELPDAQIPPLLRRLARGDVLLNADPICRHFLKDEPLYRKEKKRMIKITDDNMLVPGNANIFVRSGVREVGGKNNGLGTGQNFAWVDAHLTFAPGVF